MSRFDNYLEHEIPKYRKRRGKTKKYKSDHKHRYHREVIIEKAGISGRKRFNYAKVCVDCGKIGFEDLFASIKMDGPYFRLLTQEEVLEKYKHLPIIKEI